jgi:3D (Asp-Asp-Asp) domain-containing protein
MKRLYYFFMFVLSVLGPGACAEVACARNADSAPSAAPLFHVEHPPTLCVLATSYSWREAAHRAYGRRNCEGGLLDDTQVAADTRFFPLGTVLWIEGLGRRVVCDRGSAVVGPHHLDIHFSSLAAMRAWGTRLVHIRILP